MRKIGIFSLFFCQFLIGQNYIHLVHQEGETFYFYIQDSLINGTEQSDISFGPIVKDTVKIKLVLSNKSEIISEIYLLEKKEKVQGKEFTYLLSGKSSPLKLKYAGFKTYQKIPEPIVPIKPKIDTTKKYSNTTLEHYVELKNSKPVWFNNYPYDGRCQMPMPNSYMNYLNILMNKAQVEQEKYDIAEQTLRNNCVSVDQLCNILSHIPYELEKLKLVKLGYFSLTDTSNREKIKAKFSMAASETELNSFFKNASDYRYESQKSCMEACQKEDFEKTLVKLHDFTSDIEKFSHLKSIYKLNCYSNEQIKTLLNLFIHDREKLEAAKLLYFYSIDKANYSYISSVFSYQDNVSALNAFLINYKK
ncbi:MAG: DUF4476 domain-containing protein [Sphingobacteriaceae bacterium]|nr:DUF4476 domain-containing protein [Sphingobacteriaceae bacterium]